MHTSINQKLPRTLVHQQTSTRAHWHAGTLADTHTKWPLLTRLHFASAKWRQVLAIVYR